MGSRVFSFLHEASIGHGRGKPHFRTRQTPAMVKRRRHIISFVFMHAFGVGETRNMYDEGLYELCSCLDMPREFRPVSLDSPEGPRASKLGDCAVRVRALVGQRPPPRHLFHICLFVFASGGKSGVVAGGGKAPIIMDGLRGDRVFLGVLFNHHGWGNGVVEGYLGFSWGVGRFRNAKN